MSKLKDLSELLDDYKNGNITKEKAVSMLQSDNIEDLGFAKLDLARAKRRGFPEVIYCQGKTVEQVVEITHRLAQKNNSVLATRATLEMFTEVKKVVCCATYDKDAKIIVVQKAKPKVCQKRYIAVVTAGTSDIPVAKEAAITAEVIGNRVECIFDVGVAGIHRLFANLDIIRAANVVIVVAGMEGALASVVGGLVDKPVIAVPTSVGYGSNFGGLSALLSMLNSCASGVGVVNIDNGFGAGRLASIINKMR